MRRRELLGLGLAALAGSCAPAGGGPTRRIGYLALAPDGDSGYRRVFMDRLAELGHVVGRNLVVDYASVDGQAERLPSAAANLVRSSPDVLVAGFGTLPARAAAGAAHGIPVVFTNVGDPVGAGLVASIRRPGGNVTGSSSQVAEIGGKRLQLLLELVPGAATVGVVLNPTNPYSALALRYLTESSPASRVRLVVLEAPGPEDAAPRFAEARRLGAQSLVVLEDAVILTQERQMIDAASRSGLPVLYAQRSFPEAGGLASYGPDLNRNFRQAADTVDRILRGEAPGDLPVELPKGFEFALNLGTARSLGLDLPPMLLAQADVVVVD